MPGLSQPGMPPWAVVLSRQGYSVGDAYLCWVCGVRVASPVAADNVSAPLASRLSNVKQPVMRTRNAFSILLPSLVADHGAHGHPFLPRSSSGAMS